MGKTIAEQSSYIGTQLGQAEIGYKVELNKWGLGKTLGFGFGRPKEEADFYKGAEKDIIEDVFKGDMNAYRGFLASAAKDPVLAQKDFQETINSGEMMTLAQEYKIPTPSAAPPTSSRPAPTMTLHGSNDPNDRVAHLIVGKEIEFSQSNLERLRTEIEKLIATDNYQLTEADEFAVRALQHSVQTLGSTEAIVETAKLGLATGLPALKGDGGRIQGEQRPEMIQPMKTYKGVAASVADNAPVVPVKADLTELDIPSGNHKTEYTLYSREPGSSALIKYGDSFYAYKEGNLFRMEPGEGSTFNENGMPSKPMVYENDPYPVDDILKNDNVPDAFKIGIMRVRELADDGVDIVLAREKVALEPATNPEPSPEVEPEPEIVPVSETPAKPSQEEPVAEPIVVPQTSIIDAMGSGVMPYDPKVAELQQKLADLDPKYKAMMEYTKADGSNGCIDGIAGDRTRACVTQFIMDNGLGIKDMSIEKLTELVEAKQEKAVTAELDTEVELETQAPEITLPEYEIMKELPPSEMVASTEGANRRVGEQETFATVKEAAAARIQSAVYQQPDPSNTAQLQAFNA